MFNYSASIKDGYRKGSNRAMNVIAKTKKQALSYFEQFGEVLTIEKGEKHHGSQATR